MIKSLYARVVIAFLGAVIISLLVGWITQIYFFRNHLETIVQEKLIVHATTIIQALKQSDKENAKALMEVSNSMPFYVIQFYDSEGKLLNPGRAAENQQIIQPHLQKVLRQNTIYRNESSEADEITVGLPYLFNGSPHAIFITTQAGFLMDEINSVIDYQQLFLLGMGSILVLFATRYIVRPLQLLTKATQRMATGDFSVGFSSKRSDEIGQLTRSFNAMAAELGKLDMLRRRFVSDVSHEIQSPLTSIKGYTRVLKLKAMDEQSRVRMLTIIEEETDRLSRLCDDLLELSSLEHEQPKLVPHLFRLDEQLRKAVIRLEPLWSAHSHEMQLMLEPISILADEDKLNQVWNNLIGNSIKFTDDQGQISVSAVKKGDSVLVTITDNGIGIPEEEVSQIFKPFYKVDKARNRKIGGNGIGLSIVKRIVDLHHGEIEVSSRPGGGTTFSIKLPLQYVRPN